MSYQKCYLVTLPGHFFTIADPELLLAGEILAPLGVVRGSERWDRTTDHRSNNPGLYQLSYFGTCCLSSSHAYFPARLTCERAFST